MLKKCLPPSFITLTFIGVYLLLYGAGISLFMDFDVPWHLAAGHDILQRGALPATDPWSFAAPGIVWYNMSWIWDILLAGLENIGGLPLVYVFSKAFVAVVVAVAVYHASKRDGVGSDALILTAMLAALGFMEFDAARSYLVGYMGAALFHLLLHQSRDASPKKLWWLPLIMVLWVNSHGTFLIGFTVLGAYGLEALWYRRWAWLRQLFLVSAVCVLAVFVNPYGFGIYAAALRTLDSVATKYMVEWLPFVFGNMLGFSVWLLVFILASGFREPRIPLADKILALIWLLGMLFSVRNGNFFILLSAPFMAIALQGVLTQLESIRTTRQDAIAWIGQHIPRAGMATAACAVLIASIALIAPLKGRSYIIDAAFDPAPGIAYLEKHLQGKRVLNDFNLGGHVIYQTHGTFPVFIDGRGGTAYSEDMLSEYLDFMNLEKGWEQLLAKYRIDAIFVANSHRFAKAYEAGQYHAQWKQVYHDEASSVFTKNF